MSDPEDIIEQFSGPSDPINQIPYAMLLEDKYRRHVITSLAYEQKTRYEDGEPVETITTIKDPGAAALYAHAYSTQVPLLDLSPKMALANKLENDVLFNCGGLKYRRTKHRLPLSVAHVGYNNTINGMSTEGTFSIFLTKMGGALKEFITGARREDKK